MLVLAGATAAYANVHKTVQLDVDGQVRDVSTFTGSVGQLLADQGVQVGERDTVSATGGLREGQDIVVRHAHQITVATDGVNRTVWTTALTADEALDTLAARDADVSLVASRSSAGRAQLPLDLVLHGSVDVLVDGDTLTGQDADVSVAQLLGELGVTLEPLDRVAVRPADDGGVEVVVNRVVVKNTTTHKKVDFDSSTKKDDSRYVGTKVVTTDGKKGERTIVTRITTVDGKVTDKIKVSDKVTKKPVDEVVAVGTKARPVVTSTSSGSSSGGSSKGGPIKAGGKADSLNWAALARCESGGNPHIVSSNGLYHGLYQFSVGTWHAVGGSGLPSNASASEQTARAKMLYNRSGAGQWPVCGSRLFS
ncbi:MAG: transglycosylase family protein [Brevundimonas sp.]